jgi:tetratricopeptide (TPR) repeat protein
MTGQSGAEVDLTRLVNKVRPAVVTVVVYDVAHRVTNIATGFFVDKHAHLVTNYHVLDGKYAAEVRTVEGKTYPIKLVVADNRAVDLVKLLVDIPKDEFKWLPVGGDLPVIAEQVMVVGSPMGLEQTVSEGIVSSIRKIPGVGDFFQMSAPISPGSSGSPVIDLKGQVIGVATFQMVQGQNLNFAVAGNSISKLKPTGPGLALSLWTFNNSLQEPELAEKLCRQGYSFSINGETQKAIQFFREAIEKNPKNTLAWNGLGYCHVGLNNPAAAIKAYQEAVKTNPTDESLYFILGDYFVKLGRHQEAIESYQQVIRIKPEFEAAHFKLGMVYSQLGRLDDGAQEFNTVIRINPQAAPAYFNVGFAYAKLGRYQDAIEAHSKGLRIDPNFAPAYNDIGEAYGKLGETTAEIDYYKEAIRVDPDYAAAHYNLGYALLKTGSKSGALDEYKILKNIDREAADKLFYHIYY